MANISFVSSLAKFMVTFIAFKRMQGYDYGGGAERLSKFDRFLSARRYTGTEIHSEELEHFRASIKDLKPITQAAILSAVRQFSLYLHALNPRSIVVSARLVPRHHRPIRFCPITPSQIDSLMAATAILNPKGGIRSACMCFLIGLLYCTGLRISEARALNLGDVDLSGSAILVRRGKFRKERLVQMSPSTLEAMQQWLKRRAGHARGDTESPLLVCGWNKRLSRTAAAHCFRRLCIRCRINSHPPPRLHDLRHNYACQCIARWRQQNEDVDALLPVLANAMGHVDFYSTEIYIHINASALEQAGAKFQSYIASKQEIHK